MSQKRRQFSATFKLEVVLEGLCGEKPMAQLCRERDITDSLYYSWRDQFLARAPAIFTEPAQPSQVAVEQAGHIADLERLVGKLTLENEVLKKAKSWLGIRSVSNGRL